MSGTSMWLWLLTACALVAPLAVSAELTPDIALASVADQMESAYGTDAANRWLEGQRELEVALIEMGDVLVLGTVIGSSCSSDEKGLVYTESALDVERCFYGACAETLRFSTFGGSSGDRIMMTTIGRPPEVGQRATYILHYAPEDGSLRGFGDIETYEVEEDMVTRKAIPLEVFSLELAELIGRREPQSLAGRAPLVAVGVFSEPTETPTERFVTLEVSRMLKGTLAAGGVRVNLPEHGTIRYGDIPPLTADHEVAVFLEPSSQGGLVLVGGKRAVVAVEEATRTVQEEVMQGR